MNFMKLKFGFMGISLMLVLISIGLLIGVGFNPSIDFTGGSLLEVEFNNQIPNDETIRNVVSEKTGVQPAAIQTSEGNRIIIKLDTINQEQATSVVSEFSNITEQEVRELRFETIGPVLGQELLRKTLIAVILASLFIMGYVAWVFKNAIYGLSAILAMFHDTLILLGAFVLLGKLYGVEVDSLFVTAVLTTLSFSVHDTVVVYDRIRESKRKYPRASLVEIANKSITETLPRSLNNSMTIIFMLTALLLLGGTSIKWMSAALLLGTILGTYSSPFVAVPLLVTIQEWRVNRAKIKGKK